MKQSLFRIGAAMAIVCCLALPASAKLITTTGTKPSTGNGNSGSPYEIRTAEELRWFVNYENTRHWYPNDYAVLRCDIDLSTICGPEKGSWVPLGYSEESGAKDHWYGNLDGNGCKITGMYIDGDDFGSSDNLGFCGTVTSATIKNLVVEGDIVNAPYTTGGLVGYIREDLCTITSCVSHVNISASHNNNIGGLIGFTAKASQIEMSNCTYNGIITCPAGSGGYYPVGALMGRCQAKGSITYCSSYSHPSNKQSLPMIGFLTDNSDDTIINYNMHYGSYLIKDIYDCYYRLINNYLAGGAFCETEVKTSSEVGGNKILTAEQFASGEACYLMNQDILFFLPFGTRSFYQNIGTDPIPYGVSFGHEVVQTAKDYIDCKNYNIIYNNTGLDTNKKHTFDAEHDHCTVCNEVLNPDYVEKDAEGYFQIGTKAQMLWFVELCNTSAKPNYKMKLTADIDMETVVQDPIHEFWGCIDGQGHVLKNVYISSNTQYAGLVGHLMLNPVPYTSNGNICNLTMTGTVRGKEYTKYIGAFAGYADGNAERHTSLVNLRNDCRVELDADNANIYNNTCIGGIVGHLDGFLSNALNNGLVFDRILRTKETDDGIAGIAGRKTKNSTFRYAVNNGEVASLFDSYKNRGALANNEYNGNYEAEYVGYVKDIPSTQGGFYYSNMGSYSSGASQQGEELTRVRLASGEFCRSFLALWGQKIGVDDAPYPCVTEDHPKVYKNRYYYNCTDYSEYSNIPEDGEPKDHEYNEDHYCVHCYHLDPSHIDQDEDKAYLIETTEQWNTFAAVVNQAAASGTVMSFASARLTADLSFNYTTGFTPLTALNGKLDGAGHTMSFTAAVDPAYVVGTTSSYGSISNLYVDFPNEGATVRPICGTMNGTMNGCSVTKGVPTLTANGQVSDCAGETALSAELRGCYERVLIKLSDSSFRIYNGNKPGEEAEYTVYTGDGMVDGKVAYDLSHAAADQEYLWGQELGKDAYPRIISGLTPADYRFVAKTTTYSSLNPAGKVEYMNAGAILEHVAGYYRVTGDAASFPDMKTVTNFIVDNGEDDPTATAIEMDPSLSLSLPIEVKAGKFVYSDTREFQAGEIVPVIFPVDMPLLNIRGRVCLFNHYDAATKTLYFDSDLDMESLRANTPALVIAQGGKLLNSYELADVTIYPMQGASATELDGIRHLTRYTGESLDAGYVTMDGVSTACFYLGYDAEGEYGAFLDWESGSREIDPGTAYLAFPATTDGMGAYDSETNATDRLSVSFTGETELEVSHVMEADLMQFPFGVIPAGQWEKSSHSAARVIFFGNDPHGYSYSDLSGYGSLTLRGTPNQPYDIFLVGGDTKADLKYDAAELKPLQITLDEDGEYVLDLSDYRYVHLLEIMSSDEEYVAYDASGVASKTLGEDAVALHGFGAFPADCGDYSFYDATGVKSYVNLELDNPNALVLGGENVKGHGNMLQRTADRQYGYEAAALSLTDGYDFCSDYSVHCADVTYNCGSAAYGDNSYFITILPFDVAPGEGIYVFDKYEDGYVCFKSTDKTIAAYTPIIVKTGEGEGLSMIGSDLHSLDGVGLFNLTAANTGDAKYGFTNCRRTDVSLEDTDEVTAYDVYTFIPGKSLFSKAEGSISLAPFRLLMALPKAAAASAAPGAQAGQVGAPLRSAAENPASLGVKIDGTTVEEVVTSVVKIEADCDADAPAYNLQGIRVPATTPGILIRPAQKTLRR